MALRVVLGVFGGLFCCLGLFEGFSGVGGVSGGGFVGGLD